MNAKTFGCVSRRRKLLAAICAALVAIGDPALMAGQTQTAQTQAAPADQSAAKLSNDQLDSLVAPIALYPDPLLSQTLVASTYPLEIIQLQQWLAKNANLKDKALADAVQKQDWDPSIQAMAAFPDLVKQLGDNIKWTADLGNAFLAQQNDVMDAVQRMRVKAQQAGKLQSSEQQKVETRTVESKTVVVIEPSKPDVIYVPSYDPTVVWGAPVYAYPPVYYPPPGYYAAGMALSFGVGVAMGAAWGGCCGWGCGWGGNNNVYVNHNNNFINNSNRQNYNRQNVNRGSGQGGRQNWQHNPQHRGGAPYSNRDTASKYGGTARGDSLANRQASARQNQGQFGNRAAQAGTMDRQARAGTMDRGAGRQEAMNRGGPSFSGGDRGGDRVGNRSVSGSSGSRGSSAFGGASRDSGRSARASSQRGSSSFGGSGGRRGGGGGRRR